MALDFNQAASAEYITRRPFFVTGRHLCRVLALRTQVGKISGSDQYVAEFEVLDSFPVPLTELTPEEIAAGVQKNTMCEPLPKGDQRAWLIVKEGKQLQMFYPKIKQLNDAIKMGIHAQTKCKDAKGNQLLTIADAAVIGPEVNGKPTGWDLTKTGATSLEMELGITCAMAAGQYVWANVTRTKTKAGKVIDGVDFIPLLPGDFVKHEAVLETGAASAD